MRSVTGDRNWERVAALTGIVFVVLVVVSFLLPGTPPQIDDSAEEIRKFYLDNDSKVQVANYLAGLAGFFFIWFVGSLRAALARAEGDRGRLAALALGSGVLTVAMAWGSNAVANVLAAGVARDSEDPNQVIALFDLVVYVGAFANFSIAILLAATSIVSFRTGLFPSWLAWGGYLLVPAWLVAGIALFVDSGFFSGTGAFGFIVLGLWLVWVLAVSVVLAQRAGATAAASQGA